MKKVICIVGPTGSGKTRLSIELAKYLNTEIINGDSVSLYEKLDIGAAKVTPEQMQGIPHHLINHVKLSDNYSVFNFQQDVRSIIDNIDLPLIVGGSGLYIQSALYDYRFENQSDYIYPSLSEMIQVIQTKDPDAHIDLNNTRRIESAYRTIMSGQKRSAKTNKNVPLYDIFLIYLDMDRVILKTRLINRLDQMIDKGFIEETKALMMHDLNIIGYKEIQAYLRGLYTLKIAKEKIITATMRFAKRQKTWFLNQMQPHVYDALDQNLFEDIVKDLKEFLGAKG